MSLPTKTWVPKKGIWKWRDIFTLRLIWSVLGQSLLYYFCTHHWYSSSRYLRIKNNLSFISSLYVIIMSRTSFRVNRHSIVSLNLKELLAHNRRHIWSYSIWLNGCVFLHKLSNCGFKFCCCHWNFRYGPIVSKEFLGIQANYRVLIHSYAIW